MTYYKCKVVATFFVAVKSNSKLRIMNGCIRHWNDADLFFRITNRLLLLSQTFNFGNSLLIHISSTWKKNKSEFHSTDKYWFINPKVLRFIHSLRQRHTNFLRIPLSSRSHWIHLANIVWYDGKNLSKKPTAERHKQQHCCSKAIIVLIVQKTRLFWGKRERKRNKHTVFVCAININKYAIFIFACLFTFLFGLVCVFVCVHAWLFGGFFGAGTRKDQNYHWKTVFLAFALIQFIAVLGCFSLFFKRFFVRGHTTPSNKYRMHTTVCMSVQRMENVNVFALPFFSDSVEYR